MILIALVILLVVLAIFPTIRCALFHPLLMAWNSGRDVWFYFRHKEYNRCSSGELIAFCGLFGKGKTLSAVHKVVRAYHRYDGKPVWCPRRKKMVAQRIKVISNVSLDIPYEDFQSLEQVVLAAEKNREYDDEHDALTVTLVLGDEFSVQMNSRNFKTNIDPLFLNTILTCRHYYISLYYTAQRFGHVDALLRQVTSCVIDCDKLWRFQRLSTYDAWEMENATNPRLLTPLNKKCWFVRDRDHNAYDTLTCVGNLKHAMKAGDMMSEEEILKLQQNTQDPNTVEEDEEQGEQEVILEGAPPHGFSRAGPPSHAVTQSASRSSPLQDPLVLRSTALLLYPLCRKVFGLQDISAGVFHPNTFLG